MLLGRASRSPTFPSLASALETSRLRRECARTAKLVASPQVSWQRRQDSEWKALRAKPKGYFSTTSPLLLHPQEAKVPSCGFYVPRDLFPQSFH
jgi:hypothetical protein